MTDMSTSPPIATPDLVGPSYFSLSTNLRTCASIRPFHGRTENTRLVVRVRWMVPMTLSASLSISLHSLRLLGDCLLRSVLGGELPAAVVDHITPQPIQGAGEVLHVLKADVTKVRDLI